MSEVKTYAMIMAGGVGERFWPQSRQARPKQLLDLTGSGSVMLKETIDRLLPLIPWEHILVMTNASQKKMIHQVISELKDEQVIAEPVGRNTAACVGFAALWIQDKDPEAVMLVLPADHVIPDQEIFLQTLEVAQDWAQKDRLVTIGMQALHPEVEYGYIQAGERLDEERFPCYKLKTFKEKPDRQTAQTFLDQGGYLWNSGIFAWKTSKILQEIEGYEPELHQGLQKAWDEGLEHHYAHLPKLPIDEAVMERSDCAMVIEGQFAWNDLGLWTSMQTMVATNVQGNTLIQGDMETLDAHDNLVLTDKGVVALIGIDDCVVVRDRDAVLVCRKDRAKDVKALLQNMREQGKESFL